MSQKATGLAWFWWVFLAALGWLWYPLWAEAKVPAFRDGFHFYYPQFSWLDQCYQSGEYFPLWNPNEGLGTSVAAQPSWQLFYPLRIVWLVPFLDLPQRYAFSIILHQILAAAGMKRLAERLGAGAAASWLAGVAFALSCPVLFQFNNFIYLCSAAWIGWALMPILRLLDLKAPRDASESLDQRTAKSATGVFANAAAYLCQLATAAGLMLLAGDPQNAVNAVFIGCIALLIGLGRALCPRSWSAFGLSQSSAQSMKGAKDYWSQDCFNAETTPAQVQRKSGSQMGKRLRRSAAGGLLLAVATLVALQTHFTWSWIPQSSRAADARQITDSFHPTLAEILRAPVDRPLMKVFDFTISPWSFGSLVLPTIGGHYQPQHSRWVDALGSEGRMWVPSLYFGLLPVLLAASALRTVLGTNRPDSPLFAARFLLGLSMLALLVAMGNYSVLWVLRELLHGLGYNQLAHRLPPDSSGSFYGFLMHLIPGYSSFRYPAKWIVWSVAAWTALAAVQLNQCSKRRLSALPCVIPATIVWIIGLLIVVAGTLFPFGDTELPSRLISWMDSSEDRLLGRAKLDASMHQVQFAIHWPMVVLALAGICMVMTRSRGVIVGTILLTLVDLTACANHWITTTSVRAIGQAPVVGRCSESCWANLSVANIHDFAEPGLSNDQLRQIQLQEKFLVGKIGQLYGVATLHASAPLRPMAVVKIEQWLSQRDSLSDHPSEIDPVLGHLGVSSRLIRTASGSLEWKRIPAAKPLCEIIKISDSHLAHSPMESGETDWAGKPPKLQWNWISNSQLDIHIDTSMSATLLIRQYNDRQWKLNCPTIPNLIPRQDELFIVVQVPEGAHSIQLTRKRPWSH